MEVSSTVVGWLATGSRPSPAEGGAGPGIIERLLPPIVSGVLSRLDGSQPGSPYAEEAGVVATTAPRRRHEFLVGRGCAHDALAALNRDGRAIGVGPRREPLWPDGVVGSIAHGGLWAGAAVAPGGRARGVGLDIEPLEPPLTAGVQHLVLTTAEGSRLPGAPGDAGVAVHAAKVIFTAKECVYKALFPSTGWALEFSDVEIDLDLAAGCWRAQLGERFHLEGPDLSGCFEVADGHIFTALLWPTGGQG